jgi:type IV secretory pathway TrbL component
MFREEVRNALGSDFANGRHTGNGSTGSSSTPDLGIMKSLSEMGTAAKSTMRQLAADFSRRTNSGYTQAPQDERAPLIGRDGKDDDDDEEEEVAFSNRSPGQRKKHE